MNNHSFLDFLKYKSIESISKKSKTIINYLNYTMERYTVRELEEELIQQNKEAAKAEADFFILYSTLQDEHKQKFSQEMANQNHFAPRVIKRTERENLTRSIFKLKQKQKQFNSWSRKLRSLTRVKSSAESKKSSYVVVRRSMRKC